MTLPMGQDEHMPRTPGRSLFWSTRPHWTLARAQGETRVVGRPMLVRVGEAAVPPVFELFVAEVGLSDAGDYNFSVVLMYEVVDSEVQLRAVWSDTDEPHDAIEALRREAKLADWKRHALVSAAADVVEGDVWRAGGSSADPGVAERMKSAMQAAHKAPVTRRRDRITDQLLREVAAVYRTAHEAGEPPTKAVATHFYKSHSTAARWVGFARKAGHLEPVSTSTEGRS